MTSETGSLVFSVKDSFESNFAISSLFTIFENKLFKVSAISDSDVNFLCGYFPVREQRSECFSKYLIIFIVFLIQSLVTILRDTDIYSFVLCKTCGILLFSFVKSRSSAMTYHYLTWELFWYKWHLIESINLYLIRAKLFNVLVLILQNLLNPLSLLTYNWLEILSITDFVNSSQEKCLHDP